MEPYPEREIEREIQARCAEIAEVSGLPAEFISQADYIVLIRQEDGTITSETIFCPTDNAPLREFWEQQVRAEKVTYAGEGLRVHARRTFEEYQRTGKKSA